MATIFQGNCKHCGHESVADADSALAVLIDRHHKALEIPLNKQLVSYDTGALAATEDLCLLELAHPLEDSILQSTGLTFTEASRKGLLVRVQSVVCRECGTTFARRNLIATTGAVGCFAAFVICPIVGVVAGYTTGSYLTGFGVAFCPLLAIWAIESVIRWWWLRPFRDRAHALAQPRTCPSCRSDSVQSIARSAAVSCPSCRQKSMTFTIVGIS